MIVEITELVPACRFCPQISLVRWICALGDLGLGLSFALGVKGAGGIFSIFRRTSSRVGSLVMATSPHIRRKLSAADKAVLSEYTALAGQVVWASNAMHAKFLLVFEEVMLFDCENNKRIKRKVADSVWHALRSDDIQRAVLQAAVVEAMNADHTLTKSLIWAINAAGRLSEFRNDAVHTAFEFNNETKKWRMVPNKWAAQPKRVEKLNRVGYKRLFKLLLGDLVQLRVYVEAIYLKLSFSEQHPLPKRPHLRSIRLVQQTPPASNSQKRPAQGSRHRLQSFRQRASAAEMRAALRAAGVKTFPSKAP